MFDLNQSIERWRREFRRNPAIEDGYLEELEAHLRDTVDEYIKKGVSPEAAFEKAVESIGHPESIATEYFKTDTRGMSGRPPWRRRWWMPALIQNYMKTALRNLKRNRIYSAVNIAGLAVGMACCFLILLWVRDELSYDRFQKNGANVYRILMDASLGNQSTQSAGSPAPLGPALVDQVPGVVEFTRVQSGWKGWFLNYEEKAYSDESLANADPHFFEIFDIPFIQGDPKTALVERYSIVLTQSLAKKIFGDEDPMGHVVKISNTDMEVTGIVPDCPRNSHLQFDYVFPIINMTQWRESRIEDWDYTQFATYIVLDGSARPEEIEETMNRMVGAHLPDGYKASFSLQPLKRIHLNSSHLNTWMNVYPNPGNIQHVILFASIAFCVLVLACINFMNLTTARVSVRVREVSMRKVVGARKTDLMRQFFSETVIMAVISGLVAFVIVVLFLPAFNTLSGKDMTFNVFGQTDTILGLFGMVILTGLIAGSYPALYLSSFRPAALFQSSAQLSLKSGGSVRKYLVVFQFAFSILLIVAVTVISGQLRYTRTMDQGLDRMNIIQFAGYAGFEENYDVVRNELLANPDILNVTNGFPPGPTVHMRGTKEIEWEGKDPNSDFVIFEEHVSYDYAETFRMKMAQGRFYSREFSTDPENFVLNEKAVRQMGLEDPLGKPITYKGREGVIIGVVRDYIGGSLHHPIQPRLMFFTPRGFHMLVRYRPGSESTVIPFLEEKWKENVGRRPFRYEFYDQQIAQMYDAERHVARIVKDFMFIAIAIACLGIFGLSSFMAERRTKEIGVRKVLGASVGGITVLLSKEFLKWVLVANLIAWPVAYVLMRKWLQNFAFRMPFTVWIFLYAAFVALAIALFTVSWQSIRAARSNPVDSLRYE